MRGWCGWGLEITLHALQYAQHLIYIGAQGRIQNCWVGSAENLDHGEGLGGWVLEVYKGLEMWGVG